jgi:plasmid rolling circle replication initiator protein Rep
MSKILDRHFSILHFFIKKVEASEKKSDRHEIFLSELSPKDAHWDDHRHCADKVANHYRNKTEFKKYAQRMDFCSQLLNFKLLPGDQDASHHFKLAGAKFCRVRHCPVCQWRRSLKWKAKASEALPNVIADYPKYRWLFLTLTVENCPVTELRFTITEMNKAFAKLVKLKEWCIAGWIKSLEITYGKDGHAHPHYHCMLLVPPSYFTGSNYISQKRWTELWQKTARLDYKPIVHIKAISEKQNPCTLIPEILKYTLKEGDLIRDKEFLFEVTRQLHKTRCVSVGGVLRKYMKNLGEEPEDLIGTDETEIAAKIAHVYFGWRYDEKKYRLKK